MDLAYSWTITGTLTVFGFGLGLLSGAGKTPRRLYIVGTIVALTAAAAYGLEFYSFPRPRDEGDCWVRLIRKPE